MPPYYNLFDSEILFREFIINNHDAIKKLYLYEDKLDSMIYFYCFLLDGSIVTTCKNTDDNFDYYCDLYKNIANNYLLNYSFYKEQSKVLRITK